MIEYLILGLIVLGVLYVLATYNKFQTTKRRIEASVQEIGNQLKRQADLIPNLVESVKGYMKHEKDIFKDLTDARKAAMQAIDTGSAQKMLDVSAKLANALAPIRAVFESTPELQAAGPTNQLMEELRDTADKVMYSRRILIDLTADYNIMVVTVPSSIIAGMFSFTKMAGLKVEGIEENLQVSKEELKTPKVKLN